MNSLTLDDLFLFAISDKHTDNLSAKLRSICVDMEADDKTAFISNLKKDAKKLVGLANVEIAKSHPFYGTLNRLGSLASKCFDNRNERVIAERKARQANEKAEREQAAKEDERKLLLLQAAVGKLECQLGFAIKLLDLTQEQFANRFALSLEPLPTVPLPLQGELPANPEVDTTLALAIASMETEKQKQAVLDAIIPETQPKHARRARH